MAEEDEAMKIGPWVARKRKALWDARFAVAVANCNARIVALSISLIEPQASFNNNNRAVGHFWTVMHQPWTRDSSLAGPIRELAPDP